MATYSFGVPGNAVWLVHICVGLVLFYIGMQLLYKRRVNFTLIMLLIVLGAMVVLYHLHLLYYYNCVDVKNQNLPTKF
jgi:predicted membrane channel-forming protein YqfA (hemolysin III family)